ncbi:leishmanolysin-related zinc metalloendopeptidase [Deinococcus misasensis]|uniref:leishmanolysin-related zinc metalloendopeptidase n=1 Tax=Deinococcus misasensis TaxID=392413 RepID=UPI00068D7A1E|nr:leishmanolysin-related zinc metalloendopeptidase [Deinococcus misasensis]
MKSFPLFSLALTTAVLLGACSSSTVPTAAPEQTSPNAKDSFQITLQYASGMTATQKTAFQEAAQRWEKVIAAGLPDVKGTVNGQNLNVDDVQITASVIAMDGPGKILGRAGPELLRNSSRLPITGVMEFDSADLAMMEQNGTLKNVILHEMGHVLGLGTLWDKFIVHNGNPDCLSASTVSFNGTKASTQYHLLGQSGNVPVENQYGAGTKCGHWSESLFKTELMTGFANAGPMPLSKMTVGALEDLGYVVNYNAADAYMMPLVSSQGVDDHVQELVELPTVLQIVPGF